MSKFSCFFLGMVVGGLALYAIINFHVIRASDGFHVVAKRPPRLAEAYVDIRRFSVTDWADHAQLSAALVEGNQQQLLGDSAGSAIHQGIQTVLPTWPDPAVTQ